MKFDNYLVVSDYQKVPMSNSSNTRVYKTSLEGVHMLNIGKAVPVIEIGRGCVGLATPYELHISQDLTIVFFTMVTSPSVISEKMKKTMYKLYCISNGNTREAESGYANGYYRPDPGVMDPAMAMSMGMGRSARDVARDAHEQVEDSLWENMGLSPDDL